MQKKQNDQEKKTALNIILGLALLFLTVILCINAVNKVQASAVFSAVIGFSGTALFGAVGVCLLVGELRQLLHHKK